MIPRSVDAGRIVLHRSAAHNVQRFRRLIIPPSHAGGFVRGPVGVDGHGGGDIVAGSQEDAARRFRIPAREGIALPCRYGDLVPFHGRQRGGYMDQCGSRAVARAAIGVIGDDDLALLRPMGVDRGILGKQGVGGNLFTAVSGGKPAVESVALPDGSGESGEPAVRTGAQFAGGDVAAVGLKGDGERPAGVGEEIEAVGIRLR